MNREIKQTEEMQFTIDQLQGKMFKERALLIKTMPLIAEAETSAAASQDQQQISSSNQATLIPDPDKTTDQCLPLLNTALKRKA